MAEYNSVHTGAVIDSTITEVLNNGIYTIEEKTKLANIESNAQVNTVNSVNRKTGSVTIDTSDLPSYDTSLSGTANTTPFTPDSDYEPSTKKYVDDNIPDVSNFFNKVSDTMDDITDGTTYVKYSDTEKSKLADLPAKAYGSWERDTALILTTTPTKVTGFSPTITPVGITEASGTFTAGFDGLYRIETERVYYNGDVNPSDIVNITIDIRINTVTAFTRTGIIPSATGIGEPAVVSFSTPSLAQLSSGDEVEIYVSAEDNGGNPDDTELVLLRTTVHKIFQ